MSDVINFKICPLCSTTWKTRNEFIKDRTLKINGYQVDFDELGHGLFFFTHQVKGCFTTLALRAESFFDLNPGIPYKVRATNSEKCPGYCTEIDQLDPCEARCECAFVREVIQIIKNKQTQL